MKPPCNQSQSRPVFCANSKDSLRYVGDTRRLLQPVPDFNFSYRTVLVQSKCLDEQFCFAPELWIGTTWTTSSPRTRTDPSLVPILVWFKFSVLTFCIGPSKVFIFRQSGILQKTKVNTWCCQRYFFPVLY